MDDLIKRLREEAGILDICEFIPLEYGKDLRAAAAALEKYAALCTLEEIEDVAGMLMAMS